MVTRIAKSLDVLRSEVNAKWPNRRKDSDGWIGDASHQSRGSDHNAWIVDGSDRVVSAFDVTHDPKSGCDAYALAAFLIAKRDPRIKYIITNRKIISGKDGPNAWVPRPYNGSNPHDHHTHISVLSKKVFYDSTAPWGISEGDLPTHDLPHPPEAPPTIKPGASGPMVSEMQRLLGVPATGTYPVRSETYFALCLFQVRNALDPDGICGPATWGKLKALGVK